MKNIYPLEMILWPWQRPCGGLFILFQGAITRGDCVGLKEQDGIAFWYYSSLKTKSGSLLFCPFKYWHDTALRIEQALKKYISHLLGNYICQVRIDANDPNNY